MSDKASSSVNVDDDNDDNSLEKAKALEIEMIEKVKERIAPATGETWRRSCIYFSAYMHGQSLLKCEDFKDVFDDLESNGHIRLGYYVPLISIFYTCDVPTARAVEGFQDKMLPVLPKEEVKKIEEWKTNKQKVSHVEKSGQDYEAEMVDSVQGKLGLASKREWSTFKNHLELYLPKVDAKSCPDVANAFQQLTNKGKIKFGEYKLFEDIVRKCSVPAADEIAKYQKIIQDILSKTKKEYSNTEAPEAKEEK